MFQINKNYSTFLFDMDGTLVDTEPIGPMVFKEIFEKENVKVTPEEYDLFVKAWRRDGTDVKEDELIKSLVIKYKINVSTDDFLLNFFNFYKEEIVKADHLPGVNDFLEKCKNNNKTCVIVTSSKKDQANQIIEFHGWQTYFDLIIAEEDITHFKPNPEPYIIAMNRVKVQPENCVVFEDAKNGVIAGFDSGAFVIGLRAGNKKEQDLSRAEVIVNSFNDIELI